MTGQVTDAGSGDPVAGAEVSAARGDSSESTTTDEEGFYELELGLGSWRVSVEADGYEPASDRVVLSAGSDQVVRDFALEPPGSGEPAVGSQEIVATVPELPGGGSLVLSVTDDQKVVLPELVMAGSGDRLAGAGELRPVTVTDTRTGVDPGWDVSAVVSDFTGQGSSFGGGFLGWRPAVVAQSEGQAVVAGGEVAPGFPSGDGLSVPRTLASAGAGGGAGMAQLGAGLDLEVPVNVEPGSYSAVLTLTVI